MAIHGSQLPSAQAAGRSAVDAQPAGAQSAAYLPLYLVAAYFGQGVAQHFCLIAQPLEYFLLKNEEYNAAQVAWFLSILMIPWIVKPVFGIVSDFLPLWGTRRRSYLLLAAVTASLGFLAMASLLTQDHHHMIVTLISLTITSTAMALSTVVLCALVAAESHRQPARGRKLFALQAGAYYAASIGSGLLGGYLCQKFHPVDALRGAAFLCSVITAAVFLFSLRLEETTVASRQSLRNYARMIFATVRSRKFQGVAAFTFLWNLSPSFGTPLYFYFTQHLKFDQGFIGQLAAINSFGMLCGAGVFRLLALVQPDHRRQAVIAVLAGVASNLGYLLCNDGLSASVLEFARGLTNMVAILTIYGYAADVCPKRATATTIGLVIAVYNIGSQLGAIIGANVFTSLAHGMIQPLAVLSAVFTAACLLAVPFLPKQREGLTLTAKYPRLDA